VRSTTAAAAVPGSMRPFVIERNSKIDWLAGFDIRERKDGVDSRLRPDHDGVVDPDAALAEFPRMK
jgi:hypothetical protein